MACMKCTGEKKKVQVVLQFELQLNLPAGKTDATFRWLSLTDSQRLSVSNTATFAAVVGNFRRQGSNVSNAQVQHTMIGTLLASPSTPFL